MRKPALFLLDEPDTHLNPVWQHSYLDLIRDWTGVASDASNCQIVLTSHNPLTIAALTKEEVRVMFTDAAGKVTVNAPYTDPKTWWNIRPDTTGPIYEPIAWSADGRFMPPGSRQCPA